MQCHKLLSHQDTGVSRVTVNFHSLIVCNYQHTHTQIISFICLSETSSDVSLPRCLHLLASVTSCLSHYLPVCISVCPPLLFGFLAIPPAEYYSIYYPHGVFYVAFRSLLISPSLSPLTFSGRAPNLQADRQEGWLRTAVPLPKLAASEHERPPLIAPLSPPLSKRSTSHPLTTCAMYFAAMPASSPHFMAIVKLLWSRLKKTI